MGGKNSGNDEAKRAREEEEARQERIRQGTTRINSIFDGGTGQGVGALGADAAYDPNGVYYNADGTAWKPSSGGGMTLPGGVAFPTGDMPNIPGAPTMADAMGKISGLKLPGGGSFGDLFGGSLTPEQQFAKMRAEGKLFSGTTSKGGFDDNFFKGRRDSYINYAMPQLRDQFGKAGTELTFALDRSGLLDSSVRGQKMSELQKLFDTNEQQVKDKALSSETQARTAVEDARANLIATLNATGDAEGAANSALARSTALSQPEAYSPVGQMFTDFTAGLGTQAAAERSFAAGGPKPTYNTGLFGNSGRVVVRA